MVSSHFGKFDTPISPSKKKKFAPFDFMMIFVLRWARNRELGL